MTSSISDRILETNMYRSGEHFDAWTIAQRLGFPINKVRHACDRLAQAGQLVKKPRDGKATVYARPSFNQWLGKPWVTYHPPCPTPEELTPSTAFIYGGPI